MSTYFPIFRYRRHNESLAEEVTNASEVEPHEQHMETVPADTNEDYNQATSSLLIFPSPSSVPPTPPSTNDVLPSMRRPSLRDSIAHISSTSLSNFSIPTSISIDSSSASPWSTSQASLPSQRSHRHRNGPSTSDPKGERRLTTHGERARVDSATSSAAYSGAFDWDHLRLGGLEVELESASATSGDVEVWEWSSAPESNPSGSQDNPTFPAHPLGSNAEQGSTWPLYFRTRTTSQFTHISQQSQNSNTSNITHFSHSTQPPPTQIIPHAPLHLPLLSLIQQILGIDPETTILLTHSSSADCDLFLSSPFDLVNEKASNGSTQTDETGESARSSEEESSHRFLTILGNASNDEKAALNQVRQGIRIAAEYVPQTSSLRLIVTPFSFFPSSSTIKDILYSPVNLTTSAVGLAVSTINTGAQCLASGTGQLLGAMTRPFTRAPVAA